MTSRTTGRAIAAGSTLSPGTMRGTSTGSAIIVPATPTSSMASAWLASPLALTTVAGRFGAQGHSDRIRSPMA